MNTSRRTEQDRYFFSLIRPKVKEHKVKMKSTGGGTVDLTGSKKNLIKYMQNTGWGPDEGYELEDLKDLYPELK